ncbi:hypothetical protein FT641_18005 [Bacillus paranthracis]|uniref:hypothetical protein n=1 Tax=Bacillus paranthracis TaxID=2026186 RepID=UPI00187AFB71|nr:hypothetical protein [Bacillus paranthracis]MBE7114544.1 hypothetical protein [Bacillus paranthracis]MBE7154582.1 hypothetical protein [Bacillus paranthracis]
MVVKDVGFVAYNFHHRDALDYVVSELKKRGYHVQNMWDTDDLPLFDILVDGELRIQVFGASSLGGSYAFSIKTSRRGKFAGLEEKYKLHFENGDIRKLYRLTCDIMVFVGECKGECQTWLVDSHVFSDTVKLIRFVKSIKGKYKDNYDDWDLIERRKVR